jgi:AraC-like DNA-binding protein
MDFQFRTPSHPELRPHVALLWTWKGGSARAGVLERLMPDGESALIVNLNEDCIRMYDKDTLKLTGRLRGAVLVGVQTQPMVIDGEEQEWVFGVQFRAGGAYPFLGGMPSDETTNLHVEASDLWPGTTTLRERLFEVAREPRRMFTVAERYLCECLRKPRSRHPAVEFALRELRGEHRRTVRELVEETGLSARRFIQLFREQAGVPPKTFARLSRFQRAIGLVHLQKQLDWADVALACGYHDQAHLIHEFREFSGTTPSVYLTKATEHKNHVPV